MDLALELARCARCGKCMTVCPVYRAMLDETRLARGRVALIEKYFSGDLVASGRLSDAISSCMKCRQCENVCPSGVKLVPMLLRAKEKLAGDRGEGALVRGFLNNVVARRGAFDAAVKAAAAAQKLLPKKNGAKLRHLPLLFGGERRLPEIAGKTALNALPEVTAARGKKIGRVGLFVGCLENYGYVHVTLAAVRVLSALGVEVVTPKDQVCCGLAAASLGELGSARRFARMNAEAFNRWDLDAVITACATCTGMLANGYAEYLEMENVFRAPVTDFVEYVEKALQVLRPAAGEPRPLMRKLKIRTTYHDPCHHTHLGIHDAPRRWLGEAADFAEMPESTRCCGGGGSFSLFYFKTSREIGRLKVDAIRSAAPDAVVTACPGCMMQLDDLLGGSPRVMHVAEVLDLALGADARAVGL